MKGSEKLKLEIRKAFENVPFPIHCGIRAALLRDDWVSDEDELASETEKNDYIGNWWDVPEEHISGESLGFNYLDAKGVVFYLPAFMTLAIDKPTYRNLYTLCFYLIPIEHPSEGGPRTISVKEWYMHFCDQYKYVNDYQKKAVVHFVEYILEVLDTTQVLHPFSWETKVIEELKAIMSHGFWHKVA